MSNTFPHHLGKVSFYPVTPEGSQLALNRLLSALKTPKVALEGSQTALNASQLALDRHQTALKRSQVTLEGSLPALNRDQAALDTHRPGKMTFDSIKSTDKQITYQPNNPLTPLPQSTFADHQPAF
ncbi:MAG: hypothetical protein RIC06_26200 [Cyclobacteriaceae bacterium]